MKKLECKIDFEYERFCEKNTMERENATSVKKIILATFSGVAAIAGAVGSFFVGGPSGLRLFTSAVAGAAGGGSIGAVINKVVPRHWINSESVFGRSIRFLMDSFGHQSAIANEDRPSNATEPRLEI